MSGFNIKRGDLLPYLEAIVSENGIPVDLTGLVEEVFFIMALVPATSRSRCRAATTEAPRVVRGPAVVADAVAGKLRYFWQAGNTDVAGVYRGEFEITMAGRPVTFPSSDYIPIVVHPDLG